MNRIKILRILSFLLVGLFLFPTGCLFLENPSTPYKEITIGIYSDISGFYPWMKTRDITSLSVNTNLYNSLVEIEQGSIDFAAGLAKSWVNPNDTTWRFFLRENVSFHNGDIFDAEDVKYTFDTMKNLMYFNLQFSDVSEVRIIDDYTVDFITNEPVPTLLNKIISLYMLSKDYMQSLTNESQAQPVGTGAYKYTEYAPGETIVLESFKDYWKGTADIDKVIFRVLNSSVDVLEKLDNNELNIVRISSQDVLQIANFTDARVSFVQTPNVVYLGFDHRVNNSYNYEDGENPLSDVNVRKAVYHCLDIESFIDDNFGDTATQQSQIITSHLYGFDPNIEPLEYDIKEAQELMKQAGYQQGFNLSFLSVNSSFGRILSDWILEGLSQINVTVTSRYLDDYDYYYELYVKNVSFFVASINAIDAESTIELLLHTTNYSENIGLWNYGNYSNPEIDSLLDQIMHELDSELRKELIQEIFSIATKDVAYIPLYSPNQYYAISNNLNWDPRPSGFIWVEEIAFKQRS